MSEIAKVRRRRFQSGIFFRRATSNQIKERKRRKKMNIKDFKTCELVEELKKREGVETHIAEPYKDLTVDVNGPAIVLVVID